MLGRVALQVVVRTSSTFGAAKETQRGWILQHRREVSMVGTVRPIREKPRKRGEVIVEVMMAKAKKGEKRGVPLMVEMVTGKRRMR